MIAGAPEPVAPFSHAVEQDGWVFVTGQLPFTGSANDSPYPEGIEAQTRQALANLQHGLAGCGLGLAHGLAVRILARLCRRMRALARTRAQPFPDAFRG
jgi:enamine deaminase RidA (YjgF/YER057c/UK114 family)